MIKLNDDTRGMIERIRAQPDLAGLRDLLLAMLRTWGYSSFSHVDLSYPQSRKPFFMSTARADWLEHYVQEQFVHYDPIVSQARRRNRLFTWSSVFVRSRSGPKSKSTLVMDSAADFGFQNGAVFPHHSVDPRGRPRSAVTTLFWSDRANLFPDAIRDSQIEQELILPVWQDRVAELIGSDEPHQDLELPPLLSDRERDVMTWAARGKVVPETAIILGISENTVEHHIRAALVKLGAVNKSHGVVRAVIMGAIDP